MKKVIALFFILLLMETMGYAQTLSIGDPRPPSSPVPSYQSNNTCLFGSSNSRVYADQMDKLVLTEQDSFLKGYKKEQEKTLVPDYLRDTNFKSYIKKDLVYCAMKRIPMVSQTKKSCSTSNESGRFQKQTPCVTDQVVDYIYWGLNETMRCFGNLLDTEERRMIFKKLNHESAFGFFFQYTGGTGIAQLIGESQKDMFLPGHAGNSFLASHMNKNKNSCENFIQLVNRTKKTKSLKSCEFISIGDGIGRSLIGGIGLYLHYRSDPANPYSAENLLAYWGLPRSNAEEYKKIRSYITLGMYNRGPGAVLDSTKFRIRKGALAKKTPSEAYKIVMNLIKKSNFNSYVRAVESSTNKIFDSSGTCKI